MHLTPGNPIGNLRHILAAAFIAAALVPSCAGAADSETNRTTDVIGVPETGIWQAMDRAAVQATGDIEILDGRIMLADGTVIDIAPVSEKSVHVFAVQSSVAPETFAGNRLCRNRIRYVTLLTYYDHSMAMHIYDRPAPPEEPTMRNVTDLARMGKCASYYYRPARR